jgi:hypothetical protein
MQIAHGKLQFLLKFCVHGFIALTTACMTQVGDPGRPLNLLRRHNLQETKQILEEKTADRGLCLNPYTRERYHNSKLPTQNTAIHTQLADCYVVLITTTHKS